MSVSDNLPLRDLQKIILGERMEPLSSVEIRNLFSYPNTPESVLYIISALNRNKIDPNTTLVQAIGNATRKKDLVPIALALRYGADPNLYVNAPSVGDIHILAYVYLVLSKKSLAILNSVVIMLMAMNSDPRQVVFNPKGEVITDEYSLVEPIKGQSVMDWLSDQGYDNILGQIEGQNYQDVEAGFMTTLATFLDKPDLLNGKPKLDEMVYSHSVEVLNENKSDYIPNIGMLEAVKYLNLNAFETYINEGASPSYSDINNLIMLVKNYNNNEDLISMCQAREMLIYAISTGTILDKYQAKLIKDINPKVFNKVMTVYQQPYWVKVCTIPKGPVHDKLKLLAYQLNLYPEAPKETLCYQIKNITKADPDLVKSSVVKRQKCRISSDVSCINQFDGSENPPKMECSNKSLLSKDLYDYPDSDIAYYRDYQDNLWCFSSNNFEKMVNKKINPYTQVEFPPYYLDDVKRKIDYISTYRSMDEMPVPISDTIDTLSVADEPDNTWTDKYVEEFNKMSMENGTEIDTNTLSKADMEEILGGLGIDANLTDLDTDNAVRTFSVVGYDNIRENNVDERKFYESVQRMSKGKF